MSCKKLAWTLPDSVRGRLTGSTIDIYDLWLVMSVLWDGELDGGLRIHEDEGVFVFELDTRCWREAKGVWARYTKSLIYKNDQGLIFTINNIEVAVPPFQELKVKREDRPLRDMLKALDDFRPQVYLEGIIVGNEAVRAWIERQGQEFKYLSLVGYLDPEGCFRARWAFLAVGKFVGDVVELHYSNSVPPRYDPDKIPDLLGLEVM